MNFFYKIYNLIVKSEYQFYQLKDLGNLYDYDVLIKKGKVDEKGIEKPVWLSIVKNEIKLRIENCGKILIRNGNEIIIDEYDKVDMDLMKTYILGSSFGMLLKQRGIISIHGACIDFKGRGLIISGESGAGKSTLLNGFREKGYKFLSDDVCAIYDGIVTPSLPQQKLCGDAIKSFDYKFNEFKKIDTERNKYEAIKIQGFSTKPIKMDTLVELEVYDNEGIEIMEIKGTEKLETIIKNIYRIELFNNKMMDVKYFKNCLELAQNIKVYKLKRPKDKFTVWEQIKFIEGVLSFKINCKEGIV